MIKEFCDICGREITNLDTVCEFKLKKLGHSWYEYWWTGLTVHKECWVDRCKLIKQKREEEAC